MVKIRFFCPSVGTVRRQKWTLTPYTVLLHWGVIPIGELHTHPVPEADVAWIIKPPSDHDLFRSCGDV